MVTATDLPDDTGIRVTATELLALRQQPETDGGHRPATRRPGALAARQQGSGMDLREIRAFVPGDDPRRLDPAATARTGHPHIRSHHEDRDDITLLLADFRPAMNWGTGHSLRSVHAARWLARIGWQAIRRGGSVAVLTVSGAGLAHLGAASGDAHMVKIAHLLAHQQTRALGNQTETAPGEAFATAARIAPAGGQVFLATSPHGWQGAETALARLARRRKLTVALMLDKIETMPPKGVLAIRRDGEGRLVRLHKPDLTALSARLAALGATPCEVQP
ncbi:DUF58 domain-containing protein [Paracoccus sp. Z330]|uniref:DUF58 domain-containing protein n=1 Tax=Paracoccus onchidii TaxID=3017813 RepID=A0ABT4ZD57_9RHOB|nr:DUF58 domain-containing protein [Paracoccus onchidii]MDB6177207.1 DUF58 domain-containing protein [Paracoccus onchidii]